MEKIFDKLEGLADTAKDYIQLRVEEGKLELAEKSSILISNFAAAAFVMVVFCLVMVFGGITLAILIGIWTGKLWLGFLSMTAFYFFSGILTWRFRSSLIQLPVMNAILHQFSTKNGTDTQHKETTRTKEGA